MKFSLRERIRSFRYAFNGLFTLFREEPNALIHLAAVIIVVAAGFWLKISDTEWMLVVFAIGLVFVAELFNSAVERLADLYSRDKDERIKKIKDIAAAAVLFSALTAVVIALFIFLPKFLALCSVS